MLKKRRAAWIVVALAAATHPAGAEDVGPTAVAKPASVKACEAAVGKAATRTCLADALRAGQPAAARFSEKLGGEGYLREFAETGRVDVAYVSYLFRGNATTGLLLVNGVPSVIDVNDPAQYKAIDLKRHPAYAAIAKKGIADLWADDPARPVVEVRPQGGQTFRFALAVKSCHACEALGTAHVAYDFDAAGKFLGVRFLDLVAR